MGGEREFTAPQETTDGDTIGNLRIHESGGEVHFHDDQNSVKAAVPVAAMFDVWAKLRDGRKNKFKHKDLKNRSVLRIEVIRKKKGATDLKMSIKPMKDAISTTFQSFDRFLGGSQNVG